MIDDTMLYFLVFGVRGERELGGNIGSGVVAANSGTLMVFLTYLSSSRRFEGG